MKSNTFKVEGLTNGRPFHLLNIMKYSYSAQSTIAKKKRVVLLLHNMVYSSINSARFANVRVTRLIKFLPYVLGANWTIKTHRAKPKRNMAVRLETAHWRWRAQWEWTRADWQKRCWRRGVLLWTERWTVSDLYNSEAKREPLWRAFRAVFKNKKILQYTMLSNIFITSAMTCWITPPKMNTSQTRRQIAVFFHPYLALKLLTVASTVL